MTFYKRAKSVDQVIVNCKSITDETPRPKEFWGQGLEDLVRRGFLEEAMPPEKPEETEDLEKPSGTKEDEVPPLGQIEENLDEGEKEQEAPEKPEETEDHSDRKRKRN